jgi:hypothetical protein
MSVALEHLTADVSRKGFDRLLTNAGILSQLRDEHVSHVMQPVADANGFAGNSPRSTIVMLLSAPPVALAMATVAKCNQVVHHIATELAPAFYVMDLEAFHGTALLTPPTISLQDLDSEFRVLFRAQFKPGLLLT